MLQNLFLQHLFFAKERAFISLSFSLGVVLCCCFCKACSYLFDVSLFQNDVLFCSKRRVVLWKTTCCFVVNDVSFCSKHRVVFN